MRALVQCSVTAAMIGLMPLRAATEPQRLETPQAAVAALIAALEDADRDALVAVFGPENEDVILTGDADEDRAVWSEFLADFGALNRLGEDGDTDTLYLGRTLWHFPVVLVRDDAGWKFDAEGARDKVLLRRIGANELELIDLLKAYVAAQAEYRMLDADGDGLPTFASAVLSSEGSRDGLYWPPEPGARESPIGDFMAAADGYSLDGEAVEPEPYLGYYSQVLTRQGPSAPGGAMDYTVNGHMVGGHAMLAFPAAYGETGVMSFMVAESGVVYEADLGEETLEVAGAIDAFDPGDGWTVVNLG